VRNLIKLKVHSQVSSSVLDVGLINKAQILPRITLTTAEVVLVRDGSKLEIFQSLDMLLSWS
jgi:hypothetical protein